MDELVFAFDNNHYNGYCSLMTRKAFESWQQEDEGDSPIIVPPAYVLGGAEALARGETGGGFALALD